MATKDVKCAARLYVLAKQCECGGELKYHPESKASGSAQYPHVCAQCGKVEYFESTYPRLEYDYDFLGMDL